MMVWMEVMEVMARLKWGHRWNPVEVIASVESSGIDGRDGTDETGQ
jgi:hypothetical protein